MYGFADPSVHRDALIAFYERHNAAVRAAFAERPGALIELCWETGSGWRELAGFLGRPAPAMALPHENARVSRPRYELRRGLRLVRGWLAPRRYRARRGSARDTHTTLKEAPGCVF